MRLVSGCPILGRRSYPCRPKWWPLTNPRCCRVTGSSLRRRPRWGICGGRAHSRGLKRDLNFSSGSSSVGQARSCSGGFNRARWSSAGVAVLIVLGSSLNW